MAKTVSRGRVPLDWRGWGGWGGVAGGRSKDKIVVLDKMVFKRL